MKSPRLVLLRPRNADNLGAVARAMKNFGVSDWVVVSPNPQLLDGPGINRLAVKAFDLLETVRIVPTLAEAVSDCSWVVGTTMRLIDGQRRMTPRELALSEHSGEQPWALVFGDERNGLTNEDLDQCHALSFIPSGGEQPSLNLAQAVIIYAYELAMARRGVVSAPQPIFADDANMRAVQEALNIGLTQSQFLQASNGGRHAESDLMQSLRRARLTRKEAALWSAALRVLGKKKR